jgi:hypothetical protein
VFCSQDGGGWRLKRKHKKSRIFGESGFLILSKSLLITFWSLSGNLEFLSPSFRAVIASDPALDAGSVAIHFISGTYEIASVVALPRNDHSN